jgi:hypothetical protein
MKGLKPFDRGEIVIFLTNGCVRTSLVFAQLISCPVAAIAQDAGSGSLRELETKYIFGFTTGADIGPEG